MVWILIGIKIAISIIATGVAITLYTNITEIIAIPTLKQYVQEYKLRKDIEAAIKETVKKKLTEADEKFQLNELEEHIKALIRNANK